MTLFSPTLVDPKVYDYLLNNPRDREISPTTNFRLVDEPCPPASLANDDLGRMAP